MFDMVPLVLCNDESLESGRRSMKKDKYQALTLILLTTGFFYYQGVINSVEAGDGAEAEIEKHIWQLEEKYWQYWVDGDIEGYMSLLHDDFLGWPSSLEAPGDKTAAREFVINYLAQVKPIAFGIESGAMSVASNTAIVHYALISKDEQGNQVGDAFRITHTWVEQDGTWKVLGGMSSPDREAIQESF
jgi:hypothetical protein